MFYGTDMSKKINQRFGFITNVLGWEGQINATHIATKFQRSKILVYT